MEPSPEPEAPLLPLLSVELVLGTLLIAGPRIKSYKDKYTGAEGLALVAAFAAYYRLVGFHVTDSSFCYCGSTTTEAG